MRFILHFLLTFFFIIPLPLKAQVVASDYGDIPIERISANGWEHFEWDGSGEWTTIDVREKGILPNQSEDVAPAIVKMINNGSGKRIFKFPEGTFHLKSAVRFSKSDVQIIGSGKATKFILAGGTDNGYFRVEGKRTGNYELAKDVKRGDKEITLTSTRGLTVGNYIMLNQQGGLRVNDLENQIVKIIAKNGNTLTIDMKLGIPFSSSRATIQKMNLLENIRFSNFYMEKASSTKGKSFNITIDCVRNAEISFIESNKARASHFQAFRSTDVIYYGNKIYGNYGGGGGYQYGIVVHFCTKIHMINNEASDLRHHFATQFGSDHCVVAYNKALPTYNDYADFGQHNSKGCHNNLFEGNFGKELYDDPNHKGWGTRYTMWFRNHATSKIGSAHPMVENMNIIGNELSNDRSGVLAGPSDKNPFIAANILNIDSEGGKGETEWGDLPNGATIPASMFLGGKPEYVDRWPLYGPEVILSP